MKRGLKYGLWFAGIYLISMVLFWILGLFGVGDSIGFNIIVFFINPAIILFETVFKGLFSRNAQHMIQIPLSFISWFIIGAIIGLIADKIKKI
jgi:hypothetical protein